VRGAKQGGGKAGVRLFMLTNIIKRQPDEQAFVNGFNLGLDRNVSKNAVSWSRFMGFFCVPFSTGQWSFSLYDQLLW